MAIAGAFPWWITLVAVLLLAAMVVWANQREAALRASDARANQAEARAEIAEALVTAQAQAQVATATALAQSRSPAAAVDRSLSVLLAAERDPSDERLRALNDTFGPAALEVVRPEVEHLLSGGLHLSPGSVYEFSVVASDSPSPDQAEVRTRERWTYDERTADDQRARCLVEISEQLYRLRRAGSDWQIADIHLATSSRMDC
jgi:type II secretory pathway pseudopilin PulG